MFTLVARVAPAAARHVLIERSQCRVEPVAVGAIEKNERVRSVLLLELRVTHNVERVVVNELANRIETKIAVKRGVNDHRMPDAIH